MKSCGKDEECRKRAPCAWEDLKYIIPYELGLGMMPVERWFTYTEKAPFPLFLASAGG